MVNASNGINELLATFVIVDNDDGDSARNVVLGDSARNVVLVTKVKEELEGKAVCELEGKAVCAPATDKVADKETMSCCETAVETMSCCETAVDCLGDTTAAETMNILCNNNFMN